MMRETETRDVDKTRARRGSQKARKTVVCEEVCTGSGSG
jgi:hypothetical protein